VQLPIRPSNLIDTDQQLVNATLFGELMLQFGFMDLYLVPVMLNVLDKDDVIIVRSCIPGNVARDICFWLSYVICSYTCTENPEEGKTLH
jgi:hypothetical protein